jgi:threonine dehydrogenase-like Zn-dependent dehydrogenase
MPSDAAVAIRALRWTGDPAFAFEEHPVAAPVGDDRVIVAPMLSGICGSDIGAMRSWRGGDVVPGWPSHEILGTVVSAPAGSGFAAGDRVVGWAEEFRGLVTLVACDPAELIAFEPVDGLGPAEHIILQPLACVEHALRRLPSRGDVAIVGGGAIGGLFARRLRLDGRRVVVYDTVRREYIRHDGIEYREVDATASPAAKAEARFGTVIECVGHDARTIAFAAGLLADGGTLSVFGIPAAASSLPADELFERNATVVLGVTTESARALRDACDTLREHPRLAEGYLTTTYPPDRAGEAYRAATASDAGRCKVGIRWPADTEQEHDDQASD